MRPRFAIFLLALSQGVFGQSNPVICDNSPFLIFNDADIKSRLNTVEIDSVSNTAVLFPFPNTSGTEVNAIGYRLQDKMIYGLDGNKLVRIDGTGNSEILSTLSFGSYAGDVTPDGRSLVVATLESIITIDLESGFYETTEVDFIPKKPVQSIIFLDIAFNPSTGVLYGFDAGGKNLVTIDPVSGFIDNTRYPAIDLTKGMPAMFFDSYGNLWGLSDYLFLQLNTITGKIQASVPIPFESAGRVDGCSCPGAFNFQKSAWPTTISHCGSFDFIFAISNRTGQTQEDIALEDWLPSGLELTEIVKNPFGGEILFDPATNHLEAVNLTIPVGLDSIIVRVLSKNLPTGEYKNQAVLKNVSMNAGPPINLLSDNPATHYLLDSTVFFIKDLSQTLATEEQFYCNGNEILLDGFVLGALNYLWDTGEQDAQIIVTAPGDYVLTVQTGCETAEQIFKVTDASLELELGADQTIQIGDTLELNPTLSGLGVLLPHFWSSDNPRYSISCRECLSTRAFPIDNTVYSLQISNEYGCVASDEVAITVEHFLYAPNVFSPSMSAPNNTFFLQSKNPIDITYLRIFDRWGELVFERQNSVTNDISSGWDGTMNRRDVSSGVFVWMAEIVYANGVVERINGDVTLLK